MAKAKAIVSACLLGEFVRYDGATKINNEVITALEAYEIIPFCPEDPVMGTPRGRISVVEVSGQREVLVDESGVKVTSALLLQVKQLLSLHSDAEIVVLKSKSPSCGLGTTPILDGDGHELRRGDGIAAEALREVFDARIYDENTILQKDNIC